MGKDKNREMKMNDTLLRKLVYCIGLGIAGARQEPRLATNNRDAFITGDLIHDNLEKHIKKEDSVLLPFKRGKWEARLVWDKENHTLYSIVSESVLKDAQKQENRETPHYLQTINSNINKNVIKQITLECCKELGYFDTELLERDFEKIIQGRIAVESIYQYYVIAYEGKKGEIEKIRLILFDKNFGIAEEVSLMEYVKPDFAQLTNMEFVERIKEDTEEKRQPDKKHLVAIKGDSKLIKLKIQERKKKS